jgi:hypothetical protein
MAGFVGIRSGLQDHRSTINRGENDLDAAPLPKGQVRLNCHRILWDWAATDSIGKWPQPFDGRGPS